MDPVEYQLELKPGGDINDMYILISVAVLILIIACINFMNLATARSTERAKEVGIRKTLGSFQKQLISQFIAEAIVTTGMAMLLALVLVQLFLPGFNSLVGKSLSVPFTNPAVIGLFVLLILFIGLLAGFLASIVAMLVAWGLAKFVFEFEWVFSLWVPLFGSLSGAALALAAGWWGLRDVLRRPVVETLRRAAQ